jgi:hypothetical protein
MGLRESLRDFFTMQQAAAGAAQSTGALRDQVMGMQRQEGLQALAADIPGALESGNLNEIAGRAYGLGDPNILQAAIKQQQDGAGASSDAPRTLEQLKNLYGGYLEDAQIAQLAALPSGDQQRKVASDIGQMIGRKESSLDRDADRALRKDTQLEQTRDRFDKSLDSKLNKYRENVEAFQKLQELDPYTNVGFWPQLTTIIKKVGMDAGALSDQDRNIFITATGQRTMTQALQYIGAIDPSKNNVPPQTIKAVVDVISKMKGFSENKLKDRAKQELKLQSKVRGNRVPDDLYKEQALKYGLVANKKDDNWEFGEEIQQSKKRLDPDLLKSSGPEVSGLIEKLNPRRQAQAIQELQRLQSEGKTPSKVFIDALKKEAGK